MPRPRRQPPPARAARSAPPVPPPVPMPLADLDLADRLALVSAQVLDYRLRHRAELAAEDRARLETVELELDRATTMLRAQGVAVLADWAAEARQELLDAAAAADAALRQLQQGARVLAVACAAENLALALVAGKPQDAVKAARALHGAVAAV